MVKDVYEYAFNAELPIEEIQASLLLALLAAESIHGEAQLLLDGRHFLDAEKRVCVIDATTQVGRDLNRLFVGFLRREFTSDLFHVERVEGVAALAGA